ncbi:MAG: hypothetical protein ACOH5I_25360 [Oligoflexus sp.]
MKYTFLVMLMILVSCNSHSDHSSVLKSECEGNVSLKRLENFTRICKPQNAGIPITMSCIKNLAKAVNPNDHSCRSDMAVLAIKTTEQQISSIFDKQIANSSESIYLDSKKDEFLEVFDEWMIKFRAITNLINDKELDYEFEKHFSRLFSKFLIIESKRLAYLRTNTNDPQIDITRINNIDSNELYMAIILPYLEDFTNRVEVATKLLDLKCSITHCTANEKREIRELLDHVWSLNQRDASDLMSSNVIINSLQNRKLSLFKFLDVDEKVQELTALKPTSLTTNKLFFSNLSKLVRFSQKQRNGQIFHDNKTRQLFSGLDQNTQFIIRDYYNNKNNELETIFSKFLSNETANINNLIQSLQNEKNISFIDGNITSTKKKIDELNRKILSIKQNLESSEIEMSTYLSKIQSIQDTIENSGPAYNILNSDHLSVGPEESQYSFNTPYPRVIAEFGNNILSLNPGEVLNISVDGHWSPTCALKKSQYADVAITRDLLVGSQGFTINMSDGKTSVESYGTRTNHSNFSSFTETTSGQIGMSRIIGASQDWSGSQGTRSEDSRFREKREEVSKSQIAAFQGGLRLRDVPLPNYAAGSLIAVVMPLGSNLIEKATDIYVLGASSSFIVSEPSEIYLVVNDCNDQVEIRGNKLSLNYAVLESRSLSAEKLLAVIPDALETIRQEGAKITLEGVNTALKLQELKKKIIAEKAFDGEVMLNFYSVPQIRELFEAWLDHEIIQIQRKVELYELNLEVELLMNDLESFSKQKSNDLEEASLLNRLRVQILTDPVYYSLNAAIEDNLSFHLNYTLPLISFMDLKNESNLILNSRKRLANNFSKISEITIDLSSQEITETLIELTNEFNSLLEEAKLTQSLREQQTLVSITFPKPGHEDEKFDSPYVNNLLRNQSVWDALFNTESPADKFSMRIDFEDIYTSDPFKTLQILNCNSRNTIIEDMMMFIIFEDGRLEDADAMELAGRRINISSGIKQRFVSDLGPQEYSLAYPSFGNFYLDVGSIEKKYMGAAIKDQLLNNRIGSSGLGLSPFTDYTFKSKLKYISDFMGQDEKGYPRNVLGVTFAFLVRVDNSANSSNLKWLNTCQ